MSGARATWACVLVAGCACAGADTTDAGADAPAIDAQAGLDAPRDVDGALDPADSSDARLDDATDGAFEAADADLDAALDCAPGTTRDCATTCGSIGVQSCASDGTWTAACAAPEEVCGNAMDDDCDGVIDPAFGPIASPSVVSEMPAEFAWQGASSPRIAWTDTSFAVAWADDRTPDAFADVFLASVPRAG